MPARVVLDPAAIRELLHSTNGPVGRDLLRRARNVEAEAKRLAPVDKGLLRSSITNELRSDGGQLSARVGTNVKYAVPVHEGSRAVHGRLMRFKPRGAKVFIFRTERKAIKARPFLLNALRRFSP